MINIIKLMSLALVTTSIVHPQQMPTLQFKVVTGVPFSARVAMESMEALTDGNRIIHKSTALIARDSEGRTRREQVLSSADYKTSSDTAEGSIVFIRDPVAGVAYALDTRARTAGRMILSPTGPANIPEVKATVDDKTSALMISESLGTQILEGVLAEGTRLRRTIPSGKAGNERPLEIVSETWYSTELQTIVMSRSVDPRLGETTYKITEIHRSEPDATLFEIPTGYAVKEVQAASDSKRESRAASQ